MILDRNILHILLLLLGVMQCLRGYNWEPTMANSIFQQEPFVVVWNLPTANCQEHFGITLPLEAYGIVENKDNAFRGQNITIFYKNKFGLYPYISTDGKWLNGGIPQNVNLRKHLEMASRDILETLKPDFQGLAVVDWEEWRPLWRRNWGPKNVYKVASEKWTQNRRPDEPLGEQSYTAKIEFEQAAQAFMEKTLKMGKSLRPQGFWGFFGFPECFNYNWENKENYTGHCNPTEVQGNDDLMWLWKISSALYPSIYLPPKLPTSYHQRYVHHRLREAFRVAQFGTKQTLPVFAYSRVSYRHSPQYLTEADLVYTIGESAALGAAGVVLWGDLSYAQSPESCRSLKHYITTTLGPYVANVTTTAHMCSRELCHGRGRCVRRDPSELQAFLHLDPQQWEEKSSVTDFSGQGMSAWEQFQCHCYPQWTGASCEKPVWLEPIQGLDCSQVEQFYNIFHAGYVRNVAVKSNICPPSLYDEKI